MIQIYCPYFSFIAHTPGRRNLWSIEINHIFIRIFISIICIINNSAQFVYELIYRIELDISLVSLSTWCQILVDKLQYVSANYFCDSCLCEISHVTGWRQFSFRCAVMGPFIWVAFQRHFNASLGGIQTYSKYAYTYTHTYTYIRHIMPWH